MRLLNYFFIGYCFLLSAIIGAQEDRKFIVHTVAFYNLENLFDTINNPQKFDEASPIMELKYNRSEVYKKKVKNMARVISEIGADLTNSPPAIIGISEIENRKVIEDLANDSALSSIDYGIVHFDSPDSRGIDVALMYQKRIFTPVDVSKHALILYDSETRKRVFTRDQLLVSGILDGELMHIIVNHWPSRSGGEAKSRSKRIAAAQLNKRIIDSLQAINPYANIFSMGDLNDNPTNESIKKVLNAHQNKDQVKLKGIYNPYENFFKSGLGTTAYRDAWSLFDQILVSKPLLDPDYKSYRFYKAGIYNKTFLTTKKGKYRGYPFRSFSNGNFTNGFSDHFPVYVHIIKEMK